MFKVIVLAFLFASSTIQGSKVTDPIATPAQVKTDVGHILTSFQELETAVDRLPVDNPSEMGPQIVNIDAVCSVVSEHLDTASLHLKIIDTLPGDDSLAVLSGIEGIEPTIYSTVKTLIVKQAAISKVPLAVATLQANLRLLDSSMMRLFEKCIGAFPASLFNRTSACEARVHKSFRSVVDVYATAWGV